MTFCTQYGMDVKEARGICEKEMCCCGHCPWGNLAEVNRCRRS
jgi:hypothetical protein